MTLRPHQAKALLDLRNSMRAGYRRVVVQGPTGFGKTVVAAEIVRSALEKGNSVLFTVPAISLVGQTFDAFVRYGIPGDAIGVMQGQDSRKRTGAPVQIATVQTLQRREIPDAPLVIVDECHIRAEVIDRLMDARPDLRFVGLSATPWRRGMGLRWQHLVATAPVRDLIAMGFLSTFEAFAPEVPDLSSVPVRAGDFAERQLSEFMADQRRVDSVVKNWLANGQNRPTLVFGVNRGHAEIIYKTFQRSGVAAEYVDGDTDIAKRTKVNDKFRRGELRVVCSVRTMTTGIDLPVSCIIDAAPTKSEILHVQKIGRGLRINPGTEDLVIFDHAGNLLRLGMPDDIHHRKMDRRGPKSKKPSRPGAARLPSACPKCGHLGTWVRTCCSKDVSSDTRAGFWAMALHVDDQRGKGGRAARHLFWSRWGEWPHGMSDRRVKPDAAFLEFEAANRATWLEHRRVSR